MLIIHGDNTIASREFFLSQKKSLGNYIDLSGDELTHSHLAQTLSTPNLLGELSTLIVEGFFSRRPSNEKKKIIDYLKNQNIIFYDSKDVSLQLKSFDPKLIKNFKLPKYIYSFLESFSLPDLQSALSVDPPELILGALAKHLHNLILVKENVANLPGWQLAKLKSQANQFKLAQLLRLDQLLLDIDYRQKNSTTPSNLAKSLELWCLKI